MSCLFFSFFRYFLFVFDVVESAKPISLISKERNDLSPCALHLHPFFFSFFSFQHQCLPPSRPSRAGASPAPARLQRSGASSSEQQLHQHRGASLLRGRGARRSAPLMRLPPEGKTNSPLMPRLRSRTMPSRRPTGVSTPLCTATGTPRTRTARRQRAGAEGAATRGLTGRGRCVFNFFSSTKKPLLFFSPILALSLSRLTFQPLFATKTLKRINVYRRTTERRSSSSSPGFPSAKEGQFQLRRRWTSRKRRPLPETSLPRSRESTPSSTRAPRSSTWATPATPCGPCAPRARPSAARGRTRSARGSSRPARGGWSAAPSFPVSPSRGSRAGAGAASLRRLRRRGTRAPRPRFGRGAAAVSPPSLLLPPPPRALLRLSLPTPTIRPSLSRRRRLPGG